MLFRSKPASPEEPLDERFVEALHMTETIERLTDCVAFGTPQQKAAAAARLLSGSYLLMLEERIDRLALAKCAPSSSGSERMQGMSWLRASILSQPLTHALSMP